MKIILRNQAYIENPPLEMKKFLKELLTYPNPTYLEAKKFRRFTKHLKKEITQYQEEGSGIVVPSGLMNQIVSICQSMNLDFSIEDQRSSPKGEWPDSPISLRENQKPAADVVVCFDRGFVVAPAGAGKTVLGLEIARRLNQKTLWLTDKNQLLLQAMERAESFLGIDREDIGKIQTKTKTLGKSLTLGMVPTLLRRADPELEKEFGTIIVDEAHHIASRTFLEVVNRFWAKNVYGLTATPYRRDQLDHAMFNAIGPVLYTIQQHELVNEEELILPSIIRRNTGWSVLSSENMNYPELMSAMWQSESRNTLIAKDVVSEGSKTGNYCIVLVERVRHAERMYQIIRDLGGRANWVVGTAEDSEGNKRQIQLKDRENLLQDFYSGVYNILITTYDLLMEGFDFKPLNRLFMATPIKWKGNVEQTIGRIQRIAEGKSDARAWDYVDEGIAMFLKQARYREEVVYRNKGMPVIYM